MTQRRVPSIYISSHLQICRKTLKRYIFTKLWYKDLFSCNPFRHRLCYYLRQSGHFPKSGDVREVPLYETDILQLLFIQCTDQTYKLTVIPLLPISTLYSPEWQSPSPNQVTYAKYPYTRPTFYNSFSYSELHTFLNWPGYCHIVFQKLIRVGGWALFGTGFDTVSFELGTILSHHYPCGNFSDTSSLKTPKD